MKHYLIFFTILSSIFLIVFNADLLYMVQERSLFMSGSVFFVDCLRTPGGLLTWVALWFTQFFYYPWLGGSILLLLWLAICLVLYRNFRPASSWHWLIIIPVVALLVSTIDLGYWIYILKQQGYWFRETLGILFVSLLLWLQGAKNQSHRALLSSVIALSFYPLFGYYSVLALICILLRRVSISLRQTHTGWLLTTLIALATLIVPPVIARNYSTIRIEDAYLAGFPMIESNFDCSWMLTLPFIVAAFSLFALCVCPLQKPLYDTPKRPWLIPSAIMLFFALVVFERNCGDRNYHAEMRMYRQVEEFRWKEVLREIEAAGEAGGSTRQMALYKNLALINTNQIVHMYDYSNGDVNRVMRDSCGAYMFYTSGPLLAIHHGMTNTATRWCIEGNVEYGSSVTNLKILSLAALINGESQLANKYLTMLSMNLFQSDWVRRYYPLVADPTLLSSYPELQTLCQLHEYPDAEIYSDQGHVEGEVYRPFTDMVNPSMPAVQFLGLFYSLNKKSSECFWPQLRFFVDLNPNVSTIPVTIQEAAYLFYMLDPSEAQGMTFNFSPELRTRYDMFQKEASRKGNETKEETAARLKPKYGKTYWWYYFFNNTTLY